MAVETLSETLFKQHCKAREVKCGRIDEGTTSVADFEVTLHGVTVIAEVKQLDPNEHDVAREAAMRDGHVGSGHAPTGRLRNLLSGAYRRSSHTRRTASLPSLSATTMQAL